MSEEIMADVQRTLGRIEQKVDTALAWQEAHVAEDHASFAAVRGDIQALQLTRATQNGKTTVLMALWTGLAGVIGAAVSTLLRHH